MYVCVCITLALTKTFVKLFVLLKVTKATTGKNLPRVR